MKNFLKFLVLLAFACTAPLFVACGDDDNNDMSPDEMLGYVLGNSTDVIQSGLRGKVKKVEESEYYNNTWENDTIKLGYLAYRTIAEYNAKGFCTAYSYESFYSNGDQNFKNVRTPVSRDSKNRMTEELRTYYDEGVVDKLFKQTYSYDDAAGICVVTYYKSDNETDWTETGKDIYKLNEYGRIDWNNYDSYSPEVTKSRAMAGYELYNREVAEYDSHGNITLEYELEYDSNGNVDAAGYVTKATYTYW